MADTGPRGPQGPAGTSIDLPVAVANGGTGATTAAEAANALGIPSLLRGANIPEGANLNDYVQAGTYRTGSAAVSASVANTPHTATGFNLYVMQPHSAEPEENPDYVKQMLMPSSGATVFYMRIKTPTGGWSAWYKFAGEQV